MLGILFLSFCFNKLLLSCLLPVLYYPQCTSFFFPISYSTSTPRGLGVKADEMIYFYHSLFLVRKRTPWPCLLHWLPLSTGIFFLSNGVHKMLLELNQQSVSLYLFCSHCDRSFSGLNSCSLIDLSAVCLLCMRRELAQPGQVARSHQRCQTAEDQPLWFQV